MLQGLRLCIAQVISSPALIPSTPAKVHVEEQVMRRNEQSQSTLCMCSAKWERDPGEAGAGQTPGAVSGTQD